MSKELNQHPEQAEGAQGEREAFEAWVRREWPAAPLHHVRDALPVNDPRYGEYCNENIQRAWVGWQARAALEQPSPAPELVGRSVSVDVSTGDHDVAHRIFAEVVEVAADGTLLCEKAQDNGDVQDLERPEVVGYRSKTNGLCDEMEDCLHDPEPLMAVSQHDRIVGALRAHIEWLAKSLAKWTYDAEQLQQERDTALAKLTAMEQQEPVAHRLINAHGEVMTDWHDGPPPANFTDLCGVAMAGTRVELAFAQAGQVPEGWSGWVTQYPNSMPKLWGDRRIAELNWHPEQGQHMFRVAEVERAAAPQPAKGDHP